jgi:hypothetical protein
MSMANIIALPHFRWIITSALFIILGIVFGVIHKPKSWYLLHKIFTFLGVVGVIIGFSKAYISITFLHAYIGITTIILFVIILILGTVFVLKKVKSVRSSHIWLARIAVVLMFLVIFMGIFLYI